MNRKKWIIALAILNLVLLPFTLMVACGDVGPAAPAGEQEEGLLLANADMLGALVTQMKPGIDKMSILTDPDVIATSREAWMRDMVEISHESELALGAVLYCVPGTPVSAPRGWEGTAFRPRAQPSREGGTHSLQAGGGSSGRRINHVQEVGRETSSTRTGQGQSTSGARGRAASPTRGCEELPRVHCDHRSRKCVSRG